MWILFFVSLAVATLSGLGVGSAGLLVIFLTAVQHVPQLTAQGLNLLFFLASSLSALCVHAFRTKLLWGMLLFLIPAGLIGAYLGSKLAFFLPQEVLRRLFGALLILSGTLGLLRKNEQ
ncbi:MAG: sulfite exporter TauE/SafE family protein [Ruminococcaceae bacterium]|nr:sulfite exporter TauE/SafE family protein [Oscillospiraceae bacterium]